ncbi:MAG: hypothetical protein ACJ77E_05155 [Gaiellaceae bacterium]
MTVRPPSGGTPPPATVTVGGEVVHLTPLAEEIGRRFQDEFPDERERYGDAGFEWCVHDNRWLLGWAAEGLELGRAHFLANVRWLARVLRSRGYPAERLGRDLELAAFVVGDDTAARRDIAKMLRAGAASLGQ